MTLRVPRDVERRIEREPRRRRRSKSAVLRELIDAAFTATESAQDTAAEAHRQSLLVSERESDRDALRFIEGAADERGWS